MCKNKSELDYTRIKEEFKNMGKAFPLSEKECVGLTETEQMEINPCGTYCGKCEDYGIVCDGCRNRLGRPIWYHLYDKPETCNFYKCCEEKGCHDCSQCHKVPCSHFFEYPDPNMTSDVKQMWFKLRMENFMAQNQDLNLEIANTFEENEKFYLKEKQMKFQELETERLILKNIGYEDREFILDQFSNDEVNRYLFDEEPMQEIGEADELIKFYTEMEPRLQHRWILVLKDTGEKIGTCGFHCWDKEKECVEIGYDLNEKYWGKGYMSEALQAILEFAKSDMKVKRIEACIHEENKGSSKLAERCHFVKTEETKLYEFRGKNYLHYIYVLTFS